MNWVKYNVTVRYLVLINILLFFVQTVKHLILILCLYNMLINSNEYFILKLILIKVDFGIVFWLVKFNLFIVSVTG